MERIKMSAIAQSVLLLLLMLQPSQASEVGTSPQVTVPPSDSVVAEEGTIELECGVAGSPTVSVTWYQNDELVTLDGRKQQLATGSLEISSSQRLDEGDYHCVASNAVGSVQSLTAELQLAYIATVTTPNTQTLIVTENDPLTLSCVVPDSLPPATVLWYYQSETSPFSDSSGRIGQTLNGTLVFSHFDVTDNGKFTCEVSNELISESSTSSSSYLVSRGSDASKAFIEVEFVAQPSSQNAKAGDTLELECFTTGIPTAVISWHKDGSPVAASGRISFSPYNHILTIAEVAVDDAGMYTCTATQPTNADPITKMVTAEVTVTAPPVIVESFPVTEVFVSLPVTITCEADGNGPFSWTWRHDTQEVITSGRVDFTRSGTESSLSIMDVQESDGGVYQCIVEDSSGGVATSNELLVPTTLELSFTHGSSLQDVLVFQGSTVFLPCTALGYPPPEFSWIKGANVELDIDSNDRYSIPPSGTNSGNLTIVNSRVADSGVYRCKAANTASDVINSDLVVVTILGPPTIVSPSLSSIPQAGDSVTLNCSIELSAIAYTVTYEWTKNGEFQELLENTGDLTIPDIQESDAGFYECTAMLHITGNNAEVTQYIGSVSVTVDAPLMPPTPPLTPFASSPSSSSFTAHWDPPSSTGGLPLQSYTIEILPIGREGCSIADSQWEVATTVNPDTTQAEVDTLTPYFSYRFRVIAVNFGGLKSDPSEAPTSVQTLEDVPSAAPMSVTAVPEGRGQLRVSWQALADCTTHNGDLIGYTLRYRQTGGGYTEVGVTGAEVTSHPLTELQSLTEYEVQVAATNGRGEGPYSQVATATTSTNPEPPTDVIIQVVNSTSVRISWGPPGGNSDELTAYVVTVTEGSEGEEVARVRVGTSTESVVVSGLDPDKIDVYQYGVVAEYQGGVETEVVVGTLVEESSQSTSSAIYEEIWFIALVSVVGTLFVLIVVALVVVCCCCKVKKEGKFYITSRRSGSSLSGASSGFTEYQNRHKAMSKIVTVHPSPPPVRRETDYMDHQSIQSLRSHHTNNPSIGYPDSLLTEGSQTSGNHHQPFQQGHRQFEHMATTSSAMDGYDHMPRRTVSPSHGPARNDAHLPPPPAFYTSEEENMRLAQLPRGYSQSQESDDFWDPTENLNYRGHMSNHEPLSQTTSIHSTISVSSNEGSVKHDLLGPEPPGQSRLGTRSSPMRSSEGQFEPTGAVVGGSGSSGHSRQSSLHSRSQLPPLHEDAIMEEEGVDGAHTRAAKGKFQPPNKLFGRSPQHTRSLDHMVDGGGRRGRDMEMQPQLQHHSQNLDRIVRHGYPMRPQAGPGTENSLSGHSSIPMHTGHRVEQRHKQTFPRMNGYPDYDPSSMHATESVPGGRSAGPEQGLSPEHYAHPPRHTTASHPRNFSAHNHPNHQRSNFPEHVTTSLQNVPTYRDRYEPPVQGQSLSQTQGHHYPPPPPMASQLPPDRHMSLQHLDRSRGGGHNQHYMNPNPSLPPRLQYSRSHQHVNEPSSPLHSDHSNLPKHLREILEQQKFPVSEMPDVVRNSTSPPAQDDPRRRPSATRLQDLGHISDMHSRKPHLMRGEVPGQVWVQQPMSRAIESSSESDGETATVLSQSDGDNNSVNSLHV